MTSEREVLEEQAATPDGQDVIVGFPVAQRLRIERILSERLSAVLLGEAPAGFRICRRLTSQTATDCVEYADGKGLLFTRKFFDWDGLGRAIVAALDVACSTTECSS